MPNGAPSGTTDMGNAQIFSQQDVVAYLERKGLSGDTIKRLQIVPKGKGGKKKQSKSMKHSQSHTDQNVKLPPVAQRSSSQSRIRSASSNSTTADSQHSPRFYQEQYKLQQKSKRMRMIQNYSDAELLRMLHKKQHRRSKHSKQSKTRNKRRTASLGMRRNSRANKGKAAQNDRERHFSENEHVSVSHKESKADKLKQLQKYYSLGAAPSNIDVHHSHDDHDFGSRKVRKKRRGSRQSKQTKHNKKERALKGSKSLAQLDTVTDSTQLVHVMQKILGKDRSVAIEEYYKNLYSKHTARLPQIVTSNQMDSPHRGHERSISADEANDMDYHGHDHDRERDYSPQHREMDGHYHEHTVPPVMLTAMHNLELQKENVTSIPCVQPSLTAKVPEAVVKAAMEPDALSAPMLEQNLNVFTVEDYLLPSNYDNGLGDNTMACALLFSNAHNISVPVSEVKRPGSNDAELNLPQFAQMTRFDAMLHVSPVEQKEASSACRSTFESIEVDANDWSKILEDKRKAPCTASGSTAVLPLFIPREQRSVFHVDNAAEVNPINHKKMSHVNEGTGAHQKSLLSEVRQSVLDARNTTDTVRKDVLQRLSAPNVHKMNQPPLYQQYEQYEAEMSAHPTPSTSPKKPVITSLLNQIEEDRATTGTEMSVQQRQETMDEIIRETIDNMDDIRAECGKDVGQDEFISLVTDLIVRRISSRMDVSAMLTKSDTTNKSVLQTAVEQVVEKTPREVLQRPVSRKSILGADAPSERISVQHSHNEMGSALIGNEPLTQGARANHTEVGTALLSIKMSGLKQRLTPSSVATASIDPYNTDQPHSQLIPTDKFGPNVVTPARPPAPSTVIPDVITGNTEPYHFQSAQAQQTQQASNPSVAPTVQTAQGVQGVAAQQTPMMYQHQQPMMNQQMQSMPPMMSPMMSMPMQQMPMYYPTPYGYPPYGFSPMNGAMNAHGQPAMPQMAMQKTMPAPMVQGMERTDIEVSEDTQSIASHRSKASRRGRSSKLKRSKTATTTQYENEEDRNAAEIKDLFTKAINNRHNAVEEMLAANLDPNTKDEHGNTILHVASQNGNKRLIKVALRWGASINEQNKQGQTALHYLFAYKYENLAAYLISKGADDTVQNEFGYTCYDGLRPAGDE